MGAHFQCIALETILPTLQLPPAPAALAGPVKAWQSPLSIPNWEPLPGERNPMFLEKRVYQGSSGRVYPLPFIDRIADAPVDRAWQAIHLENEYLRVLILPELSERPEVEIAAGFADCSLLVLRWGEASLAEVNELLGGSTTLAQRLFGAVFTADTGRGFARYNG